MFSMAGRGQTWGCEEVRSLIEIWSDDHIKSQLSKTHKNSAVFSLFSKQLRERGFNRSVEQCRVKAKKLRQQYIQVRDALNKTGTSGKEKDKFPWYDDIDKILGTKPDVDPVDVVESHEIQHRHRPLSMMLLMLAQLTGLPHRTRMLTWEIQVTYPLM